MEANTGLTLPNPSIADSDVRDGRQTVPSRSMGAAALVVLSLALSHSAPAQADSLPVGVGINVTDRSGEYEIDVTNIGSADQCELVDTSMVSDGGGSIIVNPQPGNKLNLEPGDEGGILFTQDPEDLGATPIWELGIYACSDSSETDPLVPVTDFPLIPGYITIPSSPSSGGDGNGGGNGSGGGSGGNGNGNGGNGGSGSGESGGSSGSTSENSTTTTTTSTNPLESVPSPTLLPSSNTTVASAVEYCRTPAFSKTETLRHLATSVVKADCQLGTVERRVESGVARDKQIKHGKWEVAGFEIATKTGHHGVKFERESTGTLLPAQTILHPILIEKS